MEKNFIVKKSFSWSNVVQKNGVVKTASKLYIEAWVRERSAEPQVWPYM